MLFVFEQYALVLCDDVWDWGVNRRVEVVCVAFDTVQEDLTFVQVWVDVKRGAFLKVYIVD